MAAENRRNGAGSRLAGLLEKPTPPDPVEPDAVEPLEPEPAKGRGAAPKARTAKRIKGRTIYLPDDLFERILVQAHRRSKTISEYVTAVLDRQVPDHRVVRVAEPDGDNVR